MEEWIKNIILSMNATDKAIEILLDQVADKNIKRRPILHLIRANLEALLQVLAYHDFNDSYYEFCIFIDMIEAILHNGRDEDIINKVKCYHNDYLQLWKKNDLIKKYREYLYNNNLEKIGKKIKYSLPKKQEEWLSGLIENNYFISKPSFGLIIKILIESSQSTKFKEILKKVHCLYQETSSYIHLSNKSMFTKSPPKAKEIIDKYKQIHRLFESANKSKV